MLLCITTYLLDKGRNIVELQLAILFFKLPELNIPQVVLKSIYAHILNLLHWKLEKIPLHIPLSLSASTTLSLGSHRHLSL